VPNQFSLSPAHIAAAFYTISTMKSFTLLALLPIAVFASRHERTSRLHSEIARDIEARGPQYNLIKKYKGQNLLE
jgi:hypothetical protein